MPDGWTLVTPTSDAAPAEPAGWKLVEPAAPSFQGANAKDAAGNAVVRGGDHYEDIPAWLRWIGENGPAEVRKGLSDFISGNYAKGARRAVAGAGITAGAVTAPLLAEGLIAAPLVTGAALVGGAVVGGIGSAIGTEGGKLAGLSDDQSALVGDLFSVAGGYAGAKGLPAVGRQAVSAVAKRVASLTPEQVATVMEWVKHPYATAAEHGLNAIVRRGQSAPAAATTDTAIADRIDQIIAEGLAQGRTGQPPAEPPAATAATTPPPASPARTYEQAAARTGGVQPRGQGRPVPTPPPVDPVPVQREPPPPSAPTPAPAAPPAPPPLTPDALKAQLMRGGLAENIADEMVRRTIAKSPERFVPGSIPSPASPPPTPAPVPSAPAPVVEPPVQPAAVPVVSPQAAQGALVQAAARGRIPLTKAELDAMVPHVVAGHTPDEVIEALVKLRAEAAPAAAAPRPDQVDVEGNIPASKSRRGVPSATPGLTVSDVEDLGLNPTLRIKKLTPELIARVMRNRAQRAGLYRTDAALKKATDAMAASER